MCVCVCVDLIMVIYFCSHDDLAEWLRGSVKNHLSQVNLSGHVEGSQADIPRLLQGKLGGQVRQ